MLAVAGLALWLGGVWFDALVVVVGLVCVSEMARLINKAMESPTSRVIGLLLGAAYVGLAVFALIKLPINVVIAVIAIVIATDTGAYFSGRSIGGPKIAPRISPKKTWAGLIGGALAAGLVCFGFFYGQVEERAFSLMGLGAFAIGAMLAVVAQAGDFLESWLKRKAQVKDSSNLIPGHGGVFDRVDGLLPVAIVASALWFGAHP